MTTISRVLRRAEANGLAAVDAAVGTPFVMPTQPVRQPTKAVDLDELAAAEADRMREQELGMHQGPKDYDPVEKFAPARPLPSYVEHAKDATRPGMLSAQAMVMEYERAAQAIAALGGDLKQMQDQTQAQIDLLAQAFADLTKTAEAYRAEAKRVFEQIEECATTADTVSKLCEDLRNRIAE